MDTSIDRPSRFLHWAKETFGDVARFLEEAVELAHAIGIEKIIAAAIVERVHSRPAGDVPKEIGQSLATLELLAKAIGIDADQEATREF
jgi:NTP pyrophosphatase (non-canonical NTP hydrolase)